MWVLLYASKTFPQRHTFLRARVRPLLNIYGKECKSSFQHSHTWRIINSANRWWDICILHEADHSGGLQRESWGHQRLVGSTCQEHKECWNSRQDKDIIAKMSLYVTDGISMITKTSASKWLCKSQSSQSEVLFLFFHFFPLFKQVCAGQRSKQLSSDSTNQKDYLSSSSWSSHEGACCVATANTGQSEKHEPEHSSRKPTKSPLINTGTNVHGQEKLLPRSCTQTSISW